MLGLKLRHVILLSFLVLAAFLSPSEAKKKKGSKKKSSAPKIDQAKCGVCVQIVDEIEKELKKTENSTNTLDLRWGLTAEVTDGKAKRIGKVIPYKRSELRSIEIMEHVCGEMKNYGRFDKVPGEVQLRPLSEIERYSSKEVYIEGQSEKKDKDKKLFESHCEELVESKEEVITSAIRDELSAPQMIDTLCFGESDSPCGAARSKCKAGAFSVNEGLSPCDVCPHGSFQSQVGMTSCDSCGEGLNTTDVGNTDNSNCKEKCSPGHYSSSNSGLAPCNQCSLGTFNPNTGASKCEVCPDGKGTEAQGSVYANECVSKCGDGKKSTEEDCDDGNTYPADGCSEGCKIDPGYKCDGGVGSKSTCKKVECGDSKIENSHDRKILEQCDDGNTEEGDGCSATCQVEPEYTCKTEGGKSVCSKVTCGDGKRQNSRDYKVREDCDDGNDQASDGCTPNCEIEEGWTCSNSLDQKSSCEKMACGNGFKEKSGNEQEGCDDGNLDENDRCSSTCTVEEGWECTEGRYRHTHAGAKPNMQVREKDSCKRKQVCGDGFRVGDEECDDNNTADSDGCSSSCKVEEGYTCSASKDAGDGPPPGPQTPIPDVCTKSEEKAKTEL